MCGHRSIDQRPPRKLYRTVLVSRRTASRGDPRDRPKTMLPMPMRAAATRQLIARLSSLMQDDCGGIRETFEGLQRGEEEKEGEASR